MFLKHVGGLGAFLILTNMGNGKIVLTHHLTPVITNMITGTSTPSRMVRGMVSGGESTEVKGSENKTCTKGKVMNANGLLRLVSHPGEANGLALRKPTQTLRSCTFCREESITLFDGENEAKRAEDVLAQGVQTINAGGKTEDKRRRAIQKSGTTLEWVENVVCGNTPTFSFVRSY